MKGYKITILVILVWLSVSSLQFASADHLIGQQPDNSSPLANHAESFPAEFSEILQQIPVSKISYFDQYKRPYVQARGIGNGIANLTEDHWRDLVRFKLTGMDLDAYLAEMQKYDIFERVTRAPEPSPVTGVLIQPNAFEVTGGISLLNYRPESYLEDAPYLFAYYHYDFADHYQKRAFNYDVPNVNTGILLLLQPDILADMQTLTAKRQPVVRPLSIVSRVDHLLTGEAHEFRYAYSLDISGLYVDINGNNGADLLLMRVIPRDADGSEMGSVYYRAREHIAAVRYAGQWWMTNYLDYCGQELQNCGW